MSEEREPPLTIRELTGTHKFPLIQHTDISPQDNTFWNYIRSRLTPNQWKWVNSYIINGLSQKEIAQREGVTPDAVKSWSREARKRLRQEEENLKNQ